MKLTPETRRAEAISDAFWEGAIFGGLALIPTTGTVYLAMKNPRFLARTNMQSRTALAIMPALFVFAWTAVSLAKLWRQGMASGAVLANVGSATATYGPDSLSKGTFVCIIRRLTPFLLPLSTSVTFTGRKNDPQNARDCQGNGARAQNGTLGRAAFFGLAGKYARRDQCQDGRTIDEHVPKIGRGEWRPHRPWR